VTSPPPAEPAGAEPASAEPADGAPLRVSTLELFFDLVFVFTITQLTSLIAHDGVTAAGALRALLVFGVLWWIYGGYVWLTNTRTPARTPERILLLLGMAGFLIIGMGIPDAFSRRVDGVAVGLGYLLVVAVHGGLYLRVNRSILRVIPVNGGAAVLVILAGIISGIAAYWLWAAALALLVIAPFVLEPQTRFRIAPAHFVERHGAVLIIALGESVADIGLSSDDQRLTASLVICAVLGLALAALLWWTYFGVGDDERAEEAFSRAVEGARAQLALDAYFYSFIPVLLGIVTLAAGLKVALRHPGTTLPYGPCLALAGGVALFLAGDVLFRRAIGVSRGQWYRAAAAIACLATWITGVTVSSALEIALLAGLPAIALYIEPRSVEA
jgi:low temperature requirement protein LtrA